MGRQLADYYAKRAAEYDEVYAKPERQEDLRALREFLSDMFVDESVLEVACGTGYWTEVIATRAARVVATDVNEEVLEIARGRCIPEDRVRFLLGDAYAPSLTGDTFTAGFAGFWWSHVPKAELNGFLSGFHRCLAPRSRVVFIDNRYVEGSSTPVSRTDADGNTYQQRRLKDGSSHEVLKNFPDEAQLRNAVSASATEIDVRLLDYFWVLSYRLA